MHSHPIQSKMTLPPHLQHLQHLQGEELKTAVQQEYFAQAIAFIVRQTDYDEPTAVERLHELKDPIKVVAEYLGVKPRSQQSHQSQPSKNQMKYGEIRKFMDFGARQYRQQQAQQQQQQQQQAQQQAQQQQQQQQQQQAQSMEARDHKGQHVP